MSNFSKVVIGHTFKADPLSISTFDTIWLLVLTEIYRALVWLLPFGGNSSSEKVSWLVTSMEVTMFSKDGLVISSSTYASFSTFSKAFLWDSDASNSDENQQAPLKDPLHVPVGPITRARSKKIKEVLNGLIQDIWADSTMGHSKLGPKEDEGVINLIQAADGADHA